MTDIFREVEEDVRREKWAELWNRFGTAIITVAVLVFAGTAAWVAWDAWSDRRAVEAAEQYIAAARIPEDRKDDARAAFAAVAETYGGGYRTLAQLQQAGLKADAGDIAGAVAQYDMVAGDGAAPAPIRDFARLQAATLLAGEADLTAIRNRLAPLLAEGSAWRWPAREIIAFTAVRTGDWAEARAMLTPLAEATDAPDAMRTRARQMLAIVAQREPAPAAPAPMPAEAPPGPAEAAPAQQGGEALSTPAPSTGPAPQPADVPAPTPAQPN